MKIFKSFVLLILVLNLFAKELSPAEKMMELMGLKDLLKQSKALQEDALKKQTSSILEQLFSSIPVLPPDTKKEIETLFNDNMDVVLNSWTIEEAVSVYSKVWSEYYLDEEILEVIKLYENPKYKKEVQVALQAARKIEEYFNDCYNRAAEKSFSEMIPKAQNILRGVLENSNVQPKTREKAILSHFLPSLMELCNGQIEYYNKTKKFSKNFKDINRVDPSNEYLKFSMKVSENDFIIIATLEKDTYSFKKGDHWSINSKYEKKYSNPHSRDLFDMWK